MSIFYELTFTQEKNEIFIESLAEYEDQDLRVGRFIPSSPFAAKVSEGRKWYDVVRLQDPFNFAISERVYNLLKDAGFTGWSSYEIAIEANNKKYYGFQVLGRCGALKRPVEPGFVTGCEFDYDTWDGSDFFCPAGTMSVFCTEKAKEFFDLNKVTNISLEDISTVEWYSA